MQRTVLIKAGYRAGIDGSIRHGFDGDFHTIFPEFHLAVRHQTIQLTVRQFAQSHRQFQRQIRIILELPVCQIVIAGDNDLRFRFRNAHALCLFILRDIGSKGREQLGFITARRFGVPADNGFNLIRRKGGEIDVLRL